MPTELTFELAGDGPLTLPVRTVLVAGWTGRDRAAVEHHIAELAELGVAPPSDIPLYYRVSTSLLSTATEIETAGATGSGEAEPVLVDDGEALYLGLGSDHTDRELEAHSVALSKQICAKPLAPVLWPFDEVADHLDAIELRSWIRDDANADWTVYQEGTLAKIKPLPELVGGSPAAHATGRLSAGTLMMCGTVPAIGGVRPGRHFRMELFDPVRDRRIAHAYETVALPVVA